MCHVILTTPNWGQLVIKRLIAYFTWPTHVQNLKSLAVAVAEIFRGCKILNVSRDPDHAPFRGDLTSAGLET